MDSRPMGSHVPVTLVSNTPPRQPSAIASRQYQRRQQTSQQQ